MPSHKASMLTSKSFASEELFLQLAKAMKKISTECHDEYIENPYQENIELKVPIVCDLKK